MIEITDNKYFHLHNDKISYIFYVMPNGQLGHLYYGKSLGKLDNEELNYLVGPDNPPAGTVDYDSKLKNFSLAAKMQEYPSWGSSDYREGALSLMQGDEYLYPDFKYSSAKIRYGKTRDLNEPSSYGDDAETLQILLIDTEHHLELTLNYTIFDKLSAVVRSSCLKNIGQQAVSVRNLQSSVLSLPKSDYNFLQLSGAWLKERHLQLRPLEQGITKIESLRGASSHQQNPFVALVDKKVNNDHGEIYASNLIYSGNFISQAEVDEWGTCRLMTGINPVTFTWQLDPQMEFKSPEAVMFYTDAGYNGLMSETHQFAKSHVIDRKWQQTKRPIVINNWEATYFDFDENRLLKLAKQAKDLGIECFVLDDGWFGQRNADNSSLGNWSVDHQKFPQGLDHFSQQLHKLGLQFGLWIEPEMVSADTDLYKQHPDWIVRHPYQRCSIGRNQYVLDFANPEVVENIFHQLDQILATTKIEFLKWDMNRNITEAYSPYLNEKHRPQGEFFHRYIQGVYHLYALLLKKYPDLLIEGCASGGGRFDLGILYYSPQIWASDDSDAAERLDIMAGTLLAYPLSTFSNHVSAVPNEQVKRLTSLKFRQNVACFGPLGYELDLNKLSDQEEAEIKKNIAWYKEHRQLLVNGDFYQILSPKKYQNNYAWAVSSKNEQYLGFYRKLARPNEKLADYLKLKNIIPQDRYQINDHDMISGRILKDFGLRLPAQFNGANGEVAKLAGDFQSCLYQIRNCD